jgi:hypothetical protein
MSIGKAENIPIEPEPFNFGVGNRFPRFPFSYSKEKELKNANGKLHILRDIEKILRKT